MGPEASVFAPTMDNLSTNSQDRLVDHAADGHERTYALLLHLSLLAVHVAVPVVIALVMWLVKRKDSPFLDDHGREAVNFQLSLVLYAVAVVPLLGFLTCGVAWVLFPAIYVLGIVGMIMAAVAANRGEYFRYPMTFRLVH